MTDDQGTLAGLIADLEGLHQPHLDPGDPWCDQEPADWPCPTIELVRKHKRAQYITTPEDGGLETVWWCEDIRPNVDFDQPLFMGGPKQCEAWIEKQVNGDDISH